MGGKALRKCEICGIRRVRKCTSGIFLARFPLEPNRCRKWVKATGNEDLAYLPLYKLNENKFVCGDHFPPQMFNENGNRLKKFAVPTLNLLNPPLADEILADFPITCDFRKQEKKDIVQHYPYRCVIPFSEVKISEKSLKKRKIVDCPASPCKGGYTQHFEERQGSPMKRPKGVDCPTSPCKGGYTQYFEERQGSTMKTPKGVDCPTSPCKGGYTQYFEERQGSTMKTPKGVDCPASPCREGYTQYFQERQGSPIKRSKGGTARYGYSKFELTPRKKKLIKNLERSKNSLKMLSKTSVNLDKLNSDFLKIIVSEAVKNQARKSHGQRWDMKTKISCLQIFKRSPRTYRHLRLNMPLPSVRTLQRLLQEIPMEPGINAALLNQLKIKTASMPPASKLCTLIFDEISLKKRLIYNDKSDKVEGYVDYGPGESRGRRSLVADKALVFMIQGIHRKYKQPVAYYFVKGTISSQNLVSFINELVKKIEDSGFSVVATVCDQGPTNCGALSQLKQNSKLPPDANHFYVGSSKIYTIFDVPHLFKSIRNNFFEAGTMEMNGKRAKWQHLRDAESMNRVGMLYFHKISPMLLNPKQRMKMKVKYAAQTLSNTFAAILKMIALMHTGTQYGNEVGQTSDIVRDLNKLFDATNGPAHEKDVINGQRQNVSKKTNHVEVWNAFLKQISTIKFLKNDSRLQLKNVRCVQGFIMTIKSLKDIWFDCQKKGFRYLNLRQLNQDSVENLFGIVRQTSPTNKNPTCTHFTSALKTILISGLKAPHSRGANCEDDVNKLLLLFSKDSERSKISPVPATQENVEDFDDYPTIMLPETEEEEQIESDLCGIQNQPIVYLSGYLAYRLLKGSNCKACSNLLQVKVAVDHPVYKYICLREWWKDKRSLTYPTISLCRTTEKAVSCFKSNLHNFHEKNVGEILFTLMTVEINFGWWNCSSHRHVTENCLRLIIKILIRRQCQILNEEFLQSEENSANANKIYQLQSAAK